MTFNSMACSHDTNVGSWDMPARNARRSTWPKCRIMHDLYSTNLPAPYLLLKGWRFLSIVITMFVYFKTCQAAMFISVTFTYHCQKHLKSFRAFSIRLSCKISLLYTFKKLWGWSLFFFFLFFFLSLFFYSVQNMFFVKRVEEINEENWSHGF